MSVATIVKKVGVVAAVLSLGVMASAHAEMKIAVVNFQRVLYEAPQFKTTTTLLQTEFAPRQRDLQTKAKDLQGKQDRLQRDGAVMSDTERGSLEKELAKGQRDLKGLEDSLKEDIDARQSEEFGKLQSLLIGEVQNFAKNNGYDIVLTSNNVALYVKDTFDITTQVLTYLQGRNTADAKPAAAAPSGKPAK